MTALNAYLGMAVLWEALSMTIIYVWAQYNKAVNVTFMFGFRFPVHAVRSLATPTFIRNLRLGHVSAGCDAGL